MDVSPDLKRRHGFPIAKAGKSRECVFTVPAYQGICKQHNSCIKGQLELMKLDGEKGTWISLKRSLPSAVHTCVLRDAMGTPGGSSKKLCGTLNEGEEWQLIASGLGRIQGVSAFYTEE